MHDGRVKAVHIEHYPSTHLLTLETWVGVCETSAIRFAYEFILRLIQDGVHLPESPIAAEHLLVCVQRIASRCHLGKALVYEVHENPGHNLHVPAYVILFLCRKLMPWLTVRFIIQLSLALVQTVILGHALHAQRYDLERIVNLDFGILAEIERNLIHLVHIADKSGICLVAYLTRILHP